MKTERECPECGGTGEVNFERVMMEFETYLCPECHGSGEIKEDDYDKP